jgi:hypothetical protein
MFTPTGSIYNYYNSRPRHCCRNAEAGLGAKSSQSRLRSTSRIRKSSSKRINPHIIYLHKRAYPLSRSLIPFTFSES